ncbi:MAG: mannose-1-phosphate guanylyltransferase/mannose-6-phosphate isomerase [Proteobacteria bacterium]|nr:mannose-1-phosphate guanylyltransferase/mannose-6-phosphate isomerase [Pseudomonadota bacterium]MCL2307912.1 mannose-1-phosphate guanylyltransferase/mannose-6-phosphate isomerase [Pseudomonadota bacterium]
MNPFLIPVILAGGSGQRLWPLSRTEHPKPFLPLPQGGTLFGKTVSRAAALPGVETILTVTAEPLWAMSHSLAEEALSGADHKILFLTEPVGRGTAASIALAALWARQHYGEHGNDAVLLVLPADHLIENQEAFAAAVQTAVACAVQKKLVTFGVSPTRIETGFGYIEAGRPLQENGSAAALPSYDIARFIEKPPEEEARQLIAQGRVFWNAGMFCFRVGDVCEAFAQHATTLWDATQHAWQKVHTSQPDVWALEHASFSQVPKAVFDRAIMEKTGDGAVVCGAFDWNDIGSWTEWTNLVAEDRDGNRLHGDVIAHASRNTRVYAETRLVATVGVDDLIVAETADAVLVARRDHVQEVRAVTTQLARRGDVRCQLPNTVPCPWGRYTVLHESANVKVKEIEVAPGEALSLQRHQRRSEHWVVTQGTAKVTRGEESFTIQHNESAFIPAGVKHRLENPGEIPLLLIEVQCGSYFGEDDIERFDDSYGRA